MTDVIRAMFALIRSEFGDLKTDVLGEIGEEDLLPLYRLSAAHDMAHLTCDAILKNGVCAEVFADGGKNEIAGKYLKAKNIAVYRYGRLDYETGCIREVLEEEGIPYCPLKGVRMRELYPEPWQRTGCDVDILVGKDDHGKAEKILCKKLGYKLISRNSHDVGLETPGEMHVELHRDLIETSHSAERAAVCREIIDNLFDPLKNRGADLERKMTNEEFYFYHVAHMAKHVSHGGCGIRPFLDVSVMRANLVFDEEKKTELLKRGNLTLFDKGVSELSDKWFHDSDAAEDIDRFEKFILFGGVYGNTRNAILVAEKKPGSAGYMKRKIFLPYATMSETYPVLKKHPYLLPFFEVRRWFGCLPRAAEIAKRLSREKKICSSFTDEERAEADALFASLGLSGN